MPTAALINSQPPFPDNVPTCDLSKLSYRRLLAKDPAESDKLFRACKETGFFLIDLQSIAEGESLLKHAESLLQLDHEVGALSNLEKSRYASKPPEVTG
jgi:isopenicillin N synthase-like dioxygenase